MPNTPNLALPYPALADSPDGPAQFAALATALDNLAPAGLTGGTAWAPVISQSAGFTALTYTTTVSWVVKLGRLVFCQGVFVLTQAGTNGQALQLSVPYASITSGFAPVGVGYVNAAPAGNRQALMSLGSTARVAMSSMTNPAARFGEAGSDHAIAMPIGAVIGASCTYMAAA